MYLSKRSLKDHHPKAHALGSRVKTGHGGAGDWG